MSEEELKVWFWNKFNSCYAVKHIDYPDSIFWYYNESYVRKQKLCKISNEELILPTSVRGICLFEQDTINRFVDCNYNEVWNFLEKNYSTDYQDVLSFIINCFKEYGKLSLYTAGGFLYPINPLDEIDKLRILNK